MSPLRELQQLGQSIWLDYINRSLITSGELASLIREDGISGLTSNPSIFEQAMVHGNEYSADLKLLDQQRIGAQAIYELLAIKDIQAAADLLHPIYETTGGRDGFASLEVSPELSHNTEGTVDEARRLWLTVNRENLMVKVPGTPEGTKAIEILISEGINVNVTLLFDIAAYEGVAAAYRRGLSQRVARNADITRVASVASFFVSRVDTAVDKRIEERLTQTSGAEQSELAALLGKAAVANAKLAYDRYQSLHSMPEWADLAAAGARTQRLLWASTGTKNPKYSDVMYLEELIGRDTVNTVPPATLIAFRDHGHPRRSLSEDLEGARATIGALAKHGIVMADVTDALLEDAQRLFLEAFHKLLAGLTQVVSKASEAPAPAQYSRSG